MDTLKTTKRYHKHMDNETLRNEKSAQDLPSVMRRVNISMMQKYINVL